MFHSPLNNPIFTVQFIPKLKGEPPEAPKFQKKKHLIDLKSFINFNQKNRRT